MKTKIWTALIILYIVWGSTYLAIRFAVETMPPFWMASARFLMAGAILYAWRRLAGDPAPTRTEWRSAATAGLLLLVGGNGCVVWAEQHVASGVASLLVGAAPLYMVLIDAFRPNGRRPSWQTVVGVLIGLVGIAILVGPGAISGGAAEKLDPTGIIVLLLGSLLWAMGSLYSREAKLPSSPLLGAGMEMLAGGLGLALLGAITGEWGRLDIAQISARSLWGLAYLVTFGSLMGFVSYTWLLRVAPTPLVATYAYVNPLIAILLGSWLAHETLSLQIILAALIIIGSVVVINISRQPARQVEARVVFTPGDD